jgi:general secretion pathway protein K
MIRRSGLNNRGSATLLSIFLASIIITVGLGFNWYVREHLRAAEGFRLKTDAMAAAYSAFDKIIFSLSAEIPTGRTWRISDAGGFGDAEIPLTGDPVRLPGGVEVSIRDGSSFVSLQAENTEALKRLVENATGKDPSIFVDSFLDWTDADNLVRLNGAEEGYYRSINATVVPRNGPVEFKEELLFIRGMDKETYKKIEPHITLLPAAGFNPNTASVAVTRAHLGIDEEAAKALTGYAVKNRISSPTDLVMASGKFFQGTADFEYTPSSYFEVTIAGGNKPGYYRIHAGVDLSRAQEAPYSVIFWRED